MDAATCKLELRTLLRDNEPSLVQDLTHQGMPRSIGQIALTNLTPPQKVYYYILIYIPDENGSSQGTGQTMAKPMRKAEYQVIMEISDEALVQNTDVEAYETMALDFDRFTGRICDLLEQQHLFGVTSKYKLKRGTGDSDRRIEKSNLSGNFQNTEGEEVALLYSQLRFTLVEECPTSTTLYPA